MQRPADRPYLDTGSERGWRHPQETATGLDWTEPFFPSVLRSQRVTNGDLRVNGWPLTRCRILVSGVSNARCPATPGMCARHRAPRVRVSRGRHGSEIAATGQPERAASWQRRIAPLFGSAQRRQGRLPAPGAPSARRRSHGRGTPGSQRANHRCRRHHGVACSDARKTMPHAVAKPTRTCSAHSIYLPNATVVVAADGRRVIAAAVLATATLGAPRGPRRHDRPDRRRGERRRGVTRPPRCSRSWCVRPATRAVCAWRWTSVPPARPALPNAASSPEPPRLAVEITTGVGTS